MEELFFTILIGVSATTSIWLLVSWSKSYTHVFFGSVAKRSTGHGVQLFGVHEGEKGKALAVGLLYLLVLCITFLFMWLFASIPWAITSVLAVAVIPKLRRHRQARLNMDKLVFALPECLLFLASSLRTGSSLNTALMTYAQENKTPLGHLFEAVANDIRLGRALEESLIEQSERINQVDFTLFVVAIRVARHVGGNLSDILVQLAQTLRQRLVMEGRIKAMTSQGRIQGIVMTLLPVGLCAVLYFLQPKTALLFTTTIGWIVTSVAVVMLAMGYFVIQKVVAIDV